MTDGAKPLVIGVGNRNRGDDAVGPMAVDAVAERWPGRVDTAVVEGDLTTLPLLWSAEQPVVVIDAAVLADAVLADAVLAPEAAAGARPTIEPGTLIEFDGLGPDWPLGGHGPTVSTHGIGLATAVELARRLDRLPNSLTVLTVMVDGRSFGHGAPTSNRIVRVVGAIVERLGDILNLADRSPTLEAEQERSPEG